MILAGAASFFGSIWFAGLALCVGYIVGCVFPVSKITGLLSK